MISEDMTTSVPNPTDHNQWYPFANRPVPPEVDGQAVNPAVIPVFDAAPLPPSARFVVVGAGVHGLSSAYHLAMYLQRTGRGSGRDVVLIDKQGPGAGATGLACGCIRNMYMTGPLHAILRASVEVWESDPVNLGFQQVGYVSVGESNQIYDYLKLQASQAASGYPSDVYTGRRPGPSSPTCGPTSKPRTVTSCSTSTAPGTPAPTWRYGDSTRSAASGACNGCTAPP